MPGKDPRLDALEKHDRDQELADTLEEHFKRMFEGHEVPGNIRRAACLAMYRFTINGICDGMYICNTIANESGCGDGQGNFTKPAKSMHRGLQGPSGRRTAATSARAI